MQVWPIVKGAATWVPLLYDAERGSTGGTRSARYCYAVWMRHLLGLIECGMLSVPRAVAELGPGDSLGIGLAAILSGADRLHAFDVVRYAHNDRNLAVLRELVALFRARAEVPGEQEFPNVFPRLKDHTFPSSLRARSLDSLLTDERVEAVARALREGDSGGIEISYVVPWNRVPCGADRNVDLVYSQAVLEHVEELAETYRAMAGWLRPGAYASHVIDFRSHHITPGWDGHLQYPARLWRIVRGRRPYLLNRQSVSAHLDAMRSNGLEILSIERERREPTVSRAQLASEFRHLSDADRETCTVRLVTRRAGSEPTCPR